VGAHKAVSGGRPPLTALCAPTGKAAARLQEELPELQASTIHRLLGWRGGRDKFGWRYNAENRLPHDVVIVDEASMVPLVLMDQLLAALRSDARLVLVGDPDQLTAVEAGAVLRDIVGPAADGLRFSHGMRALVTQVVGSAPAGADETSHSGAPAAPLGRSFGDGIVVLRRGHRFGEAIQTLADAIRHGDPDAALAAITADTSRIMWLAEDSLEPLRKSVVQTYGAVTAAARSGDGLGALQALAELRLLCAHRRGRYSVQRWTAQIEEWLAQELPDLRGGAQPYAGQPLLVTKNDHELRLSNGDTGVVVRSAAEDGALMAAFEHGASVRLLAPSRLGAVEPLYAMTIHKSQGSQFETAAVILPEPDSPILTRELLYTAVTRARRQLILVGAEESVRAAVARPVGRATGLQERLWGMPAPDLSRG